MHAGNLLIAVLLCLLQGLNVVVEFLLEIGGSILGGLFLGAEGVAFTLRCSQLVCEGLELGGLRIASRVGLLKFLKRMLFGNFQLGKKLGYEECL